MSPTVFRYKGYRFFFFSREEERKHGFWLFVRDREFFLDFDNFPWFRNAKISSVLNVELPQPHHLYWPDLDVDLDLDTIEFPGKYPLVDQNNLN